jgi:hypothetical protein
MRFRSNRPRKPPVRKLGQITAEQTEQIAAAIALCAGYDRRAGSSREARLHISLLEVIGEALGACGSLNSGAVRRRVSSE